MTIDPDDARRKFEESFFWAVGGILLFPLHSPIPFQNLDPGNPNSEARPTFADKTTNTEKVWDAELKQEGEKKVEIKMQESELQTIIDCRTIFDREKTEKRTGEKTSCPIC